MKEEISESIHFFNVIEPISKDVISEMFVGELTQCSNETLEKESLRRLKAIYSDDEILKLKSNIPKNYKVPFESRYEILLNLVEYSKNFLVPIWYEIQEKVVLEYTEEEEKQISELKNEYRNKIQIHFKEQLSKVLLSKEVSDIKNEKIIKEIELNKELANITPNLLLVWHRNSQEFKTITRISAKHSNVILNSNMDFIKLIKERFKIKIGRLGNFTSTVMGFDPFKEKIEISLMKEVLLLK